MFRSFIQSNNVFRKEWVTKLNCGNQITVQKRKRINFIAFGVTVGLMVLLVIFCSDRFEYGHTNIADASLIVKANGEDVTIDTKQPEENQIVMQSADLLLGAQLLEFIIPNTEKETAVLGSKDGVGLLELNQQENSEADKESQPEFGMLTGRVLDPDKPMIAITFDDGPYAPVTDPIVDIFLEYESRATFFVVGYNASRRTESMLNAYNNGFEIANHTKSHGTLTSCTKDELKTEVDGVNELLSSFGITGNLFLRPPYGNISSLMEECINVPMVTWTVDSEDWLSKNPETIVDRIIGKVVDGDIIIMHDIYKSTLDAVQIIVPELTRQGFQLVTVSELFDAKGIEPESGVCYNSAK